MVNSLFGHVHRNSDGLVYGKPRKKSENTPVRYTSTNRKAAPRERSAIIMLRRRGYTYNQLASAFERSTNYIYQVCRKAMNLGTLKYQNYKFTPFLTKMLTCNNRLGTLIMRLFQWQKFIDGEEDKPP